MRSQLKWTLAALAIGILAMVGFAVAAAARGDGGEAEPRAIRMETELAPGRDLQFFLNPNPSEVREVPAVRAGAFVGVTLAQTDEGVEITGVVPGSPAAEADLREGDLIRAIDGEKVDSVEAVIGRVRDAEAGDELTFIIEREGRELDIEVRLAPERARLELPPGHGGIPPGRLRERLPEFDLEDLLPEDFPQRAWRFVERRDLLDEALERFISAQVRYLDEDGKPASVQALGGTVSGVDVSEGTLTVTGNEPRAAPQPFTITEDTRIRRDFRRADLADLEVNDRVVVIAAGEGDEAAVVLAFSLPEES